MYMIVFCTLLTAIYILNLMDYIVTLNGICMVGIETEANPLGRFLFEHHMAWFPKVVVMPIILAMFFAIDRIEAWGWEWNETKRPHISFYMVCAIFVLYLYVVINNMIVSYQLDRI